MMFFCLKCGQTTEGSGLNAMVEPKSWSRLAPNKKNYKATHWRPRACKCMANRPQPSLQGNW